MRQSSVKDLWVKLVIHDCDEVRVRFRDITGIRKTNGNLMIIVGDSDRYRVNQESYDMVESLIEDVNSSVVFDDGALFRLWAKFAERSPAETARAIMHCITATDLREAITKLTRTRL